MRESEAQVIRDRIHYIMPYVKDTHIRNELEDILFQIKDMTGKRDNLKLAIHTLLHDSFDSPDLEVNDSDDTFVDYIINAITVKNKNKCPYKLYSAEKFCKFNVPECECGLNLTCNRAIENVWLEFIQIN